MQAGADIVAPSDMMDGRIGAIREALEEKASLIRKLWPIRRNMPPAFTVLFAMP